MAEDRKKLVEVQDLTVRFGSRRNPYCLKIDTLMDPPMFQVSETHFAKTWLLDPRAPKVEKPEAIQNLHEKLLEAFNI